MHNERVTKLREQLAAKKLSALLVTDLANVFYLSGFSGSTAIMLVTDKESCILVDPRYTIQAQAECPSTRVIEYTGKAGIAAAAELANELKPGVIGYEANNLTVASFQHFRKHIEKGTRLRVASGIVEKLRMVKDASELAVIRDACVIADKAFKSILGEIKVGMTEKEIGILIDMTLRKHGASKESFDTIVAAGPHAACPHAQPGDAVLERGQLLKMDFGAHYNNYNSDITRTICLGEADAKQKEVYQIVLDAQMKAIEAIAPGKPGKDIDKVAREHIASKGYGENFGHGLGHGLGIRVHDHAGLSSMSDVVLQPGMVVTVEPGIYIEDWGGIRIEDDVLVTETGFEVLTHAPKQFTCI